MNKTSVFMAITTMISIVCFNFNKILNVVLSFIFENFYDESIFRYGPYMKSKPIIIECVMIDSYIYTNKTKLLLNWKWNFDIAGFITSDVLKLKPDAKLMIMRYRKKYGPNQSHLYTLSINFTDNTMTENNIVKDIMFEEICLK